MKVLLISEHYFPKIAGTVSYVHNTAIQLAKKGVEVHLLIPGFGKKGALNIEKKEGVILLKVGVSEEGALLFNGAERDIFCSWITDNTSKYVKDNNFNIVHLMFGLFVSDCLNTNELRKNGIKTIQTIHNIPPEECSNSWPEDSTFRYLKDKIRKYGVRLVNKKRITRYSYDTYITPSSIVKSLLERYLPNEKIEVIGHGRNEEKLHNHVVNRGLKSDTIKILTVGGFVPHKNQHLIPEVILFLNKHAILVEWNLVGPIRNKRYHQFIKDKIKQYNLEKNIKIFNDASDIELANLYQKTNLYIQLSSEEGFCMSILDAISYGIPTLGTPAGAIPEMLEMAGGNLIEGSSESLKHVIKHYITIIDSIAITQEKLETVNNTFTWKNAASKLISIYNG